MVTIKEFTGNEVIATDLPQKLNENFKSLNNGLSNISVMRGSTSQNAGEKGLVPQPKAGDNNSCLFGDGTYKKVTGLPIGFEFFSFTSRPPVRGAIPYLGGTFSRTTYKELFEKMQRDERVVPQETWNELYKKNDGNVAVYGDGDGSTTFTVPSITCYIKGARNFNSIGLYTKEGLPNITGEITSTNASYGGVQGLAPKYGGAFTPSVDKGVSASGKAVAPGIELHFDASSSNPIYGASTHVTPQTMSGIFYVIATGTVTNNGSTDLSQFAQDVTNLGTRVSGIERIAPKRYIVETYQNGKNWYEKYNDGWVRQGGHVAAPPNGSIVTVTLLKPMANTDYTITFGMNRDSYSKYYLDVISNKYTTKMDLSVSGYSTSGYEGSDWIVEGQGAV